MKRYLGPILGLVLLIGVGIALYLSFVDAGVVLVRGLIGSEKEEFFRDPEVVELLRRHGLAVEVQKAGSRTIALQEDLTEYDFAFPAGVPAAEKIRREQGIGSFYNAFFTPMTIASWLPVAEILEENGIVRQEQGHYFVVDMKALLEAIEQEKRWNELENPKGYDVNKSILITSTDIRQSNSAAMYLALASYVANDNQIVHDQSQIKEVLPLMEEIFLKQGFTEYSSAGPFEDYLSIGMGKSPLVMIYEAQFLYQASLPTGGIRPDMVLMYPEPTIFTKHILIPFSENGKRLGELLENDPELQKLAIKHGFRNSNVTYFQEVVEGNQISVPQNLVNVVEPPSYEILEEMIQHIETKY